MVRTAAALVLFGTIAACGGSSDEESSSVVPASEGLPPIQEVERTQAESDQWLSLGAEVAAAQDAADGEIEGVFVTPVMSSPVDITEPVELELAFDFPDGTNPAELGVAFPNDTSEFFEYEFEFLVDRDRELSAENQAVLRLVVTDVRAPYSNFAVWVY